MAFPLYELQSSKHAVISPGEIQMLNAQKLKACKGAEYIVDIELFKITARICVFVWVGVF